MTPEDEEFEAIAKRQAKKQAGKFDYNHKFTDKIKELAKEAGFIFWSDEEWRPMSGLIDWSCDYDDELVKFYHLVKGKNI